MHLLDSEETSNSELLSETSNSDKFCLTPPIMTNSVKLCLTPPILTNSDKFRLNSVKFCLEPPIYPILEVSVLANVSFYYYF